MDIFPLNQKIPYDAAKWQKIQVLLDSDEWDALLDSAEGRIYDRDKEISRVDAKAAYRRYIDALKRGESPASPSFAWSWTLDSEALYILDTGFGHQIKSREPVVQITHHQMNYVPEEKSFRSNLFGPETISWGLQFAFPQLFMEPVTKDVVKVLDPVRFKNVLLFKMIRTFLREQSIPTPFEGGNAPQRIGKKALQWVNSHPHLIQKGLKVQYD